ncbi:MAG: DUF4126 domain-containing protein [Altererythrobacter sp.]|nr:DUF4126 domain-containing protein [Altererythrobacter sp.]MBT8432481.1 DUF4126 domain-containing protein [Altererythrobacter sp.]NNE48885.1 DUF4126 domain-containing protein [Altererythrobacter sp.]NNF94399.1 DUF4126 domain-containing protein [Altererythrobacter sp.]NNK46693.1 DUF4126 domain-containing protein [Altererythrobacter sp.]
MGIMEIIGIAGSVSLLSGWRLYLCIFATGIAMRSEAIPVPENLAALAVLANPWVIGIAFIGVLAEFFADKVMWLDSLWDTIHTLFRPIGGALLALAIVDPSDPAMQVIAFLLGGGASLATHAGKAGTRAVVNTSPEPVSNVALSSIEDAATIGLLYLVYEYPLASGVIALVLLALTAWLLMTARRIIKRALSRSPDTSDP